MGVQNTVSCGNPVAIDCGYAGYDGAQADGPCGG